MLDRMAELNRLKAVNDALKDKSAPFNRRFSFLFAGYAKEYYWWEVSLFFTVGK